MKEKHLFSIRDLCDHWGVTQYRVEKMVKKGILDQPMERDSESETRIWSLTQLRRCEERIRQISAPPPITTTTIRLSEKMKARIRSRGLPQKTF